MLRRAREASDKVSWLLVLLPVTLSLLYVREYGVNVVYWDQWEMATLFHQLSAGALSFSDLWAPHNEHRFFFPRIAMLGLGMLTSWNNLAEMYLILACLFVTLVTLLFAFRATVGLGPLFFVPVAFLVFSLRQSSNMLWGYQVTFAFAQTFGILALYLLYTSGRERARRFAFPAALVAATVAAFSAVQGLMVWPAGLLQLFLASVERRTKRILASIWAAIGLVQWVVYFSAHDRDVGSSVFNVLARPFAAVEHYLVLLGNSLLSRESIVLFAGAALIGLVAAVVLLALRDGTLQEHTFWLSLLSFSLLALTSITAGRLHIGPESALASRYTIFSLPVVVGAYVMLTKLRNDTNSRLATVAFAGLLAIIATSVAVTYWHAPQIGSAERKERQKAALVLSSYESRPDSQLDVLHKRPESVRRRAVFLKDLCYNVFAKPQGRSSSRSVVLTPDPATRTTALLRPAPGVRAATRARRARPPYVARRRPVHPSGSCMGKGRTPPAAPRRPAPS